jgi:hypothetical protein
MMGYCTWDNRVFGRCPSSNVSKNTTFWKHCAPAVGELCIVGVSHLASIPGFMDGYFESCYNIYFPLPFLPTF